MNDTSHTEGTHTEDLHPHRAQGHALFLAVNSLIVHPESKLPERFDISDSNLHRIFAGKMTTLMFYMKMANQLGFPEVEDAVAYAEYLKNTALRQREHLSDILAVFHETPAFEKLSNEDKAHVRRFQKDYAPEKTHDATILHLLRMLRFPTIDHLIAATGLEGKYPPPEGGTPEPEFTPHLPPVPARAIEAPIVLTWAAPPDLSPVAELPQSPPPVPPPPEKPADLEITLAVALRQTAMRHNIPTELLTDYMGRTRAVTIRTSAIQQMLEGAPLDYYRQYYPDVTHCLGFKGEDQAIAYAKAIAADPAKPDAEIISALGLPAKIFQTGIYSEVSFFLRYADNRNGPGQNQK